LKRIDRGAHQIPGKLPANRDHPAHAGDLSPESFAERLDRLCAPKVKEAEDGDRLQIGQVYLAPGGDRHMEIANSSAPRCLLSEGAPINGHRPSVDALFDSVVKVAGPKAIGVILTGMGRDGAAGLLRMRQAGAETVGQNEKTCVVYGMPRVAYEIGGVGCQLPLNKIGEEIIKLTTTTSRKDRVA
jgi:two-component system chemotaxis response regulator CheB